MESSEKKRDRLLENLSAHIPQALSVQYWRKEKEVHAPRNKETDDNGSGSKSENKFIDLAGLVCSVMEGNEYIPWEQKCAKVKEIVGSISKDNIIEIERLTQMQNESDIWHKARFARVTASRCHEVMTRMTTLEKDKTQNSDNIVKRFLYPKSVSTKAMEMGRKWEKTAFHKYILVMKRDKHVNLRVKSNGMFVSDTAILGASPDGLISCDCHGNGVLEIKCATKYWNEDPKASNVVANLPYLCMEGKALKKSHKYHSQVQFQMGITGMKWCDFVVFTMKCMEDEVDPLIIRVQFDNKVFGTLANAAEKFWYEHLLREMVVKQLGGEVHGAVESLNVPSDIQANVVEQTDHLYATLLHSNTSSGNNCPICHILCVHEKDISAFSDRSIGCDGCNAWFHFGCIGMTPKKLKEIGEKSWFCIVCAN